MTIKNYFFFFTLLLLAVVLSRYPALTTELQSYPADTTKWAAPAVNFATYRFKEIQLPLLDQGDYGLTAKNYYYRWPLLPFYVYGIMGYHQLRPYARFTG